MNLDDLRQHVYFFLFVFCFLYIRICVSALDRYWVPFTTWIYITNQQEIEHLPSPSSLEQIKSKHVFEFKARKAKAKAVRAEST